MRVRDPKRPGTYVVLKDRQNRKAKARCLTIEEATPEQVEKLLVNAASVSEPRRQKAAAQ